MLLPRATIAPAHHGCALLQFFVSAVKRVLRSRCNRAFSGARGATPGFKQFRLGLVAMQLEIASAPPRPKLRLSWAGAARLTLSATILLTLLFELALAERKYALFGGGFGQ